MGSDRPRGIEGEDASSRDRFFEMSPDMLCIAGFDGVLHQINPRFASVLGYPIEELLELNYFSLPHPEDMPLITSMFETLVNGASIIDLEFRLLRSDGQYLWTDWRVHADLGRNLIYAVARDVTASRSLREQLRQSQRMDAIGQLAGGIAHDFNNLLQSMMANASFILADAERDSGVEEHANEVLDAATRAADLTSQLLTFARRQPLERKTISLNVVASGLLKMLGRLIRENIELDLIEGHDLAFVSADPAQFEQVLVNLCVNARDAMPGGGRLTIETENVLINGNYRQMHPWAKPGRYVLLTVTDTGHGMDEDTRRRIFEPFFTTKSASDGTGLGLSTTYGIVQQHDGFIHVYSEVDRGTTFKIYLPSCERKAGAVGTKVEDAVRGGTETILVAEDDELVRNIVNKILLRFGYNVLLAEDGAEALRIFELHRETIDLVLMDVVMPRMGGPAAAKAMRGIDPDVCILFCSGYADPRSLDGEELEMNRLIQKPFEPDALLRRLRIELDR